eukprot:IDg14773t1
MSEHGCSAINFCMAAQCQTNELILHDTTEPLVMHSSARPMKWYLEAVEMPTGVRSMKRPEITIVESLHVVSGAPPLIIWAFSAFSTNSLQLSRASGSQQLLLDLFLPVQLETLQIVLGPHLDQVLRRVRVEPAACSRRPPLLELQFGYL